MDRYLAMTVSRFDNAAAAYQTVMNIGCAQKYDIPPIKHTIAECLGGEDTLFTPQTNYGALYAAAPYLGQNDRALRPEMGAVLDMLKVELARQILAKPEVALKARVISQQVTFWRDARLAESMNVSPTTAMYLKDAANRATLRARFPQAQLSDERIDRALQYSNAVYKTLPKAMQSAPLKAQVKAFKQIKFV